MTKMYLSRNTVLLDQGLLCEVELQWIVSTETDIKASLEKRREWVALIVQKKRVV